MAPWILLALLGLGVPPPPATAAAEVHAVWLSYPWWRLPRTQKETLASYLADKGVNRVYLSVYDEGRMRWAGTALAQAGYAEAGEAVAAAYRRIKTANPTVTVSASPVGSYGSWKHNQRWGEWVRDGHVDAIATQAYITPVDPAACRPGAGPSRGLAQTVAIFKGELASLSGQPELLEDAVAELKAAGGDERLLELDDRRPMVAARRDELAAATRKVPIVVGYAAHRPDEAGCVVEEMRAARRLGFPDAALWVSAVAPTDDGRPNPAIADDLDLLGRTGWR